MIYIDDRADADIDQDLTRFLEEAVERALARESIQGPWELSLSLVSLDEIKELNRDYRQQDKPTDVLSFPVMEYYDNLIMGDVVICYSKAVDQAKEYSHSLEREILYLFLHSVFHLLGYDHMDEEDKLEMRQAEEEVLQEMGIER